MKPNAVIYSTLAIAYARNGLTCRAEGMIPEMQNHDVQPNERLCDTIVGGYIKEGKIEEALRFVHRMKDLGVHLEIVRFNSLLKVFLNMAYREGAHEVSFLFMFRCFHSKVSYYFFLFCGPKYVFLYCLQRSGNSVVAKKFF